MEKQTYKIDLPRLDRGIRYVEATAKPWLNTTKVVGH